jgi:RNA polymerase sigma factor (sigma-70 family)
MMEVLDDEAINAIFDQYAPALYKYSLRSCHNETVAEQIVENVFERLLEENTTGQAPTKRLRTYLYHKAYQLLLIHSRANPQNALHEVASVPNDDKKLSSASPQSEEQISTEALTSALYTDLTYEQRHVIILRFLEDFSLKETSEILGGNISNVKVIQNKAIGQLRKALGFSDGWSRSPTIDALSSALPSTVATVASWFTSTTGKAKEKTTIDHVEPNKRQLRVFLCHAHKDSAVIQEIYKHLTNNNLDVWLDKEKLLPGSDWEYEIRDAVRTSDIVIICLSKGFDQKGFRQNEVRIALDESRLQPEGEIFIIPARLEECEVLPSLRHLHWVNLFASDGYEKLMRTLKVRAQKVGADM